MSAAAASSAPVQVLAASQGMGLLAPCLFSAQWQLAVPSPPYEDARLFLHRLCAVFLHWPMALYWTLKQSLKWSNV